MKKYLLLAALLLVGCADMPQQEKRGVVIFGVAAGLALVAVSAADDKPDDPVKCTTVIRPTPGGGIGTNVTFC